MATRNPSGKRPGTGPKKSIPSIKKKIYKTKVGPVKKTKK